LRYVSDPSSQSVILDGVGELVKISRGAKSDMLSAVIRPVLDCLQTFQHQKNNFLLERALHTFGFEVLFFFFIFGFIVVELCRYNF
jgi:hypothetical protein